MIAGLCWDFLSVPRCESMATVVFTCLVSLVMGGLPPFVLVLLVTLVFFATDPFVTIIISVFIR